MPAVYTAENTLEARLVADMLEEADIGIELRNVDLIGSFPDVPVRPEIWLRNDGDWDAARKVIAIYESNRKKEFPDVICGSCGETNPGNFELCWKCRHELPSTESAGS